jgi:UDP-N-acetylglucosamine 2-epimerase
MKIISVVGARPNFMKIAPFITAIEEFYHNHNKSISHILVQTVSIMTYARQNHFSNNSLDLSPM